MNKIVVLHREPVSMELEYEYYDTKEEAQDRCVGLRKHYSNCIWIEERDLIKLLVSAE